MMPWWMKSPSPFTIAQWILLTFLGGFYIYFKGFHAPTSRHKLYLLSCVAATLGFVVLSSDFVWSLGSLLRWHTIHPDSVLQMIYILLRDVAGCVFCLFLMAPLIHDNYVTWTRLTTGLWIGNVIFFILWFGLASSPAWTDWTYAFKRGLPWIFIWKAFFISHVVGRVITSGIYLSLFNRKKYK